MDAEDPVARRDALKKQLTDVHRAIEVAQRIPVSPVALGAAIEQARRDQDALTSPVLEDLRETAETLSDDIEHVWLGICRSTALAETLADNAPTVPRPPTLLPAISAAIAVRSHVVEQLRTGDIDTVTLADVPPHPHLERGSDDGAR